MEKVTVRVRDQRELTRGVREIDLENSNGGPLPGWSAGTHIDLELPNGMVRQYSLCGPPGNCQVYRIAVLVEESGRGGSQFIHHHLRPGDELSILAVRNTFPLASAQRHVLVAGGIGITPLRSMILELDRSGADWELHYGGRSRKEMAYSDELSQWSNRVTIYAKDEVGRLPLTDIIARGRNSSTTMYACGPPGMLTALQMHASSDDLVDLHMERFIGVERHDSDSEFTVVLARSGRRVEVSRSNSVLEVLEECGVDIMSSCRTGICGTCEVVVLAGEPDHRDTALTDGEKAAGTLILPCVSRSNTPVLELDI